MIIYETTNLINGKKYIGKDERNLPEYLGSGKNLTAAIEKYGIENFSKKILAYAKDKKELEELEIYYIALYDAQKSKIYYNIAPGGTGGKIAENYEYREREVVEVDVNSFEIIGEYKSGKEAAIQNNLNYKCLNAVCNRDKRFVKERIFTFKEDYNRYILKSWYHLYKCKVIYLSLKTGIYYFNKTDLYNAEFSYYKTFDAFINQLFKYKEKFSDSIVLEKI